jgi:chromosome segregation ATPase
MDYRLSIARIGHWFRNLRPGSDSLPLEHQPAGSPEENLPARPPQPSIWRPWARRDAAIASLQDGFGTLSELMESIRDNLERQGRRHDEMISCLSILPELLQSLPESHRMHAEALQTLARQVDQQVEQQKQLGGVLAQLSQSNADQHDAVVGLHERVQTMARHNEVISDNLRQVGSAMESMGRSSESSTQVLRQLHEQISTRNGEMERSMRQHNARLTVLLIAAISLSAAAVIGVLVVAFSAARS